MGMAAAMQRAAVGGALDPKLAVEGGETIR